MVPEMMNHVIYGVGAVRVVDRVSVSGDEGGLGFVKWMSTSWDDESAATSVPFLHGYSPNGYTHHIALQKAEKSIGGGKAAAPEREAVQGAASASRAEDVQDEGSSGGGETGRLRNRSSDGEQFGAPPLKIQKSGG